MGENTIKPATFRLNEFKDFATQNSLNQQEAFTSLLNTLELNNAKSTLGGRSNSIEHSKQQLITWLSFILIVLKKTQQLRIV
ncbi:hypothetical protein EXM65_14535 [Clostridium botulinum]|uniref:Uncharacterized protein n=1 Tax=Clostridium botulinum TaxID=1491 RepID=A0A6M0SVG5_CLOBO|nr:hypothetical protein [Clostridium botulinum]